MTYHLILGDYAYSSWSLRAWLLFEKFDIPREVELLDFDAAPVADQMAAHAPAVTVPTMITPDGALVGDSLAIAEELASRHPDLRLWPSDPKARATARTLAAEMHAGFFALRSACPMNLRAAYVGFEPNEAVTKELRRLEKNWSHARRTCSPAGPWLCGDYSIADAFYAPVAARIAGYGLSVDDDARTYVAAHLADPAFRRWRAMGLVHGATLARYARPEPTTDWPGPKPRPARAVAEGTPENAACPYSGSAVADLLEIDGRVLGFCNSFCRDKTVADPEAWPPFVALL